MLHQICATVLIDAHVVGSGMLAGLKHEDQQIYVLTRAYWTYSLQMLRPLRGRPTRCMTRLVVKADLVEQMSTSEDYGRT